MNKILIETINLKKTYKHLNGDITLFRDLNIKIKQVEGETQKMRNNLNAVHGALQQMDKLIKMERVLGTDGPAKPASLEIEEKEEAKLLNEGDK